MHRLCTFLASVALLKVQSTAAFSSQRRYFAARATTPSSNIRASSVLSEGRNLTDVLPSNLNRRRDFANGPSPHWRQQKSSIHQESVEKDATNDSASIDAYMKYLQKRYDRLYGRQPRDGGGGGAFSVLKWLRHQDQQQGSSLTNDDGQSRENALHVLGLAGSASRQVLREFNGRCKLGPGGAIEGQAHGYPGQDAMTRPVKGRPAKFVEAGLMATSLAAAPMKDAKSLLNYLARHRRVLMLYQTRKLNQGIVALAQAVVYAFKRMGRLIWTPATKSGKRILGVACVSAVLVLALLRVLLAQAVASNSTAAP